MFVIWRAFRRFWETDRGLSILLFFLFVMVFAVPATGFAGTFGRMAFDILFTLLMLSGVASVSNQRSARIVVGVIVVVALVVRWVGAMAPSPATDIATASSALASIATLGMVVLAQVFRAGPVNRHRIFGAIAVYLLLGIAWAEAYQVVVLISPDAFAFASAHAPGLDAEELLYYSFVTLTTVGYGDITPVAPVARSLAMLEALTGQLYLAILLARLVALEVGSKSKS